VKLTSLTQTCGACPSQWEGRATNDDRPVYIRFRHGRLSIRIGPPGDTMDSAVGGIEIYHEYIGGQHDGQIDWPEVEKRVRRLDADIVIAERAKKMGFYTAPLTDQRSMLEWIDFNLDISLGKMPTLT